MRVWALSIDWDPAQGKPNANSYKTEKIRSGEVYKISFWINLQDECWSNKKAT